MNIQHSQSWSRSSQLLNVSFTSDIHLNRVHGDSVMYIFNSTNSPLRTGLKDGRDEFSHMLNSAESKFNGPQTLITCLFSILLPTLVQIQQTLSRSFLPDSSPCDEDLASEF